MDDTQRVGHTWAAVRTGSKKDEEKTLTPALSHYMGEGGRKAFILLCSALLCSASFAEECEPGAEQGHAAWCGDCDAAVDG